MKKVVTNDISVEKTEESTVVMDDNWLWPILPWICVLVAVILMLLGVG